MKKLVIACFALFVTTLAVAQKNEKTIVVYFSATGKTEKVAQDLARVIDCNSWQILPYEPYTDADLNSRNKESRTSLEMSDPNERPMIKMCTNLYPYEIIYIGFPIWWGVCPRIINSWVENNDFTGKILVPFATSGSSGIEGAVKYLRELYPEVNWHDGKLLNKYSEKELKKWVESIQK